MHLRSIYYASPGSAADYPFSVPAIVTLDQLDFHTPVTFFAGENGSGKSTLLEAIAAGVHAIPVRGQDPLTEQTLAPTRELAKHLSFSWSTKTRRGFFLRAEDFFDYTKHLTQLMGEMAGYAEEFDERFTGYGRDLARGAVLGQYHAIAERYGEDPNARSHGEGFLNFFGARFTGEGLYLLDEPDTALSAQSVLGLMAMLKLMVAQGAQFIIATHHPMLLAFPDAAIISFDRTPVAEVTYADVEQVALMREFLNHPGAFLRHL